jgi:hypothetical protein
MVVQETQYAENPETYAPSVEPQCVHKQIASLAHALWQERGCPEGSPEEYLFKAERELVARSDDERAASDRDLTVTSDTMIRMSLPCESKRLRAYAIEFGAGGNRLGCKFLVDDGSILFIHESQITPEIESLMVSLGSPTNELMHSTLRDETDRKKGKE